MACNLSGPYLEAKSTRRFITTHGFTQKLYALAKGVVKRATFDGLQLAIEASADAPEADINYGSRRMVRRFFPLAKPIRTFVLTARQSMAISDAEFEDKLFGYYLMSTGLGNNATLVLSIMVTVAVDSGLEAEAYRAQRQRSLQRRMNLLGLEIPVQAMVALSQPQED